MGIEIIFIFKIYLRQLLVLNVILIGHSKSVTAQNCKESLRKSIVQNLQQYLFNNHVCLSLSPVGDESIVVVLVRGLVFPKVPLSSDVDEVPYVSNLKPVPVHGDGCQ